MIEIDWLSGKDPRKMLDYLLNGDRDKPDLSRPAVTTDRKLRLFACGAVRQVWHLLGDARSRAAVEVAERRADGLEANDEVAAASKAVRAVHAQLLDTELTDPRFIAWSDATSCLQDGTEPARQVVLAPSSLAGVRQCDLLRCVFGNPFRSLPECWWCLGDGQSSHDENHGLCTVCGGSGHALPKEIVAWQGGTVRRLAQAIYTERAWDRLPFLADALEEAGCTDQATLDHLRPRTCPECKGKGRRGPGGGMQCLGCYGTGKIGHTGPHTRGCWVLDLLLGKS